MAKLDYKLEFLQLEGRIELGWEKQGESDGARKTLDVQYAYRTKYSERKVCFPNADFVSTAVVRGPHSRKVFSVSLLSKSTRRLIRCVVIR
jgi:hypothetical protein